jgi:hypothetical protein
MASNGEGAGTAVAGFLGLGAVGLFAEALSDAIVLAALAGVIAIVAATVLLASWLIDVAPGVLIGLELFTAVGIVILMVIRGATDHTASGPHDWFTAAAVAGALSALGIGRHAIDLL